jgi:hypothetical protein
MTAARGSADGAGRQQGSNGGNRSGAVARRPSSTSRRSDLRGSVLINFKGSKTFRVPIAASLQLPHARVGWCLSSGIIPEEADADLLRLASLN